MPGFEQFPQPQTPEQKISQEQKEKIKKIEQLNFGAKPRAEAILILLGLKPATEFETYKWGDNKEKVANALIQVGLETDIKEPSDKEKSENVTAFFTIAKNKKDLKKLLSLDPSKDHVEYGKLMGYPESAIRAFRTKEALAFEDALEPENLILEFKLSKSNWQKEIKILRQWDQAIKKYAPALYKELKPE